MRAIIYNSCNRKIEQYPFLVPIEHEEQVVVMLRGAVEETGVAAGRCAMLGLAVRPLKKVSGWRLCGVESCGARQSFSVSCAAGSAAPV